MQVAPLIYSRTDTEGFSPNFLVYPEGFSDSDKAWAQGYVVPILSKAGYLDDACRICSFQNEQYVVIGLCSMAKFLWDDEKYHFVNETRPNYGFFGYVFKKVGFESFPIPKLENENIPEIFKKLYQHVVEHWEITGTDLTSYPCPYEDIPFEEIFGKIVGENCELPKLPGENEIVLLPQEQFNLSSHIVKEGYSFCFNMIEEIEKSPFDYVFMPRISEAEVRERLTSTGKKGRSTNDPLPSEFATNNSEKSADQDSVEEHMKRIKEHAKQVQHGILEVAQGAIGVVREFASLPIHLPGGERQESPLPRKANPPTEGNLLFTSGSETLKSQQPSFIPNSLRKEK